MAKITSLLILTISVIWVSEVRSSSETMKKITSGFLKVVDECKHELNLTDSILSDLYHFWKEDFELLNRDTGCAIVCMSKKLNILDSSGKLHHGNTQEFAMQHGADGDIATKLVALIHECEKEFDSQEDVCLKALEVAKCFRKGIHALNWAPKMDVIITEVLTEI